jgi:ATP-dependent Clp protease adaptor protein ClpS
MTDLGSAEHSTWSVLILNDDHTPMEFVVHALEEFFDMDHETAKRLMLRIHNDGTAVCGTYSQEVARAKATQVVAFAREHRHPLQCVIERKQ